MTSNGISGLAEARERAGDTAQALLAATAQAEGIERGAARLLSPLPPSPALAPARATRAT